MIEENNLAGSCEEISTCVDQLAPNNEANNENDLRQPVIRTCPEVIAIIAIVSFFSKTLPVYI